MHEDLNKEQISSVQRAPKALTVINMKSLCIAIHIEVQKWACSCTALCVPLFTLVETTISFVGIKVDPKVKFGGDGLTYKARVSWCCFTWFLILQTILIYL